MTSQDRLLAVAIRAMHWFNNHTRGNALNGMYDDILIGRDLYDAIEAVETQKRLEIIHQISPEEFEARR